MPAFTGMRFLSSARINRIIGALAEALDIARPLIYLDRLNLIPAFDDELVGRFKGKVFAADLIADDQEAVVQESIQLELLAHTAPNIKLGTRLGQRLLNRLKQWESGQLSVTGENALRDWDNNLAANLLLGVRQRMNALACAMMIDAWSYSRLGIIISGATFGMPADLKVTVSVAWNGNPTTATPISDIMAINQVATQKYGIRYNKITMGSQDFRAMVATTEFANRATLFVGGTAAFLLTSAALTVKDDPRMRDLAQNVLGMTVEIDDAIYNVKANNGTVTSTRVLPQGTVLLSRAEDERNNQVMDFANGVPTESVVADMIGGGPNGLSGEQYGPIAYYTSRDDLNPPDVTAWAVAKAFPRKHVPEATAVLLGV